MVAFVLWSCILGIAFKLIIPMILNKEYNFDSILLNACNWLILGEMRK